MLSKNITLELKKFVMPTGHQIVPLFTTGEIWKFEATVVKLDSALIRMNVLNAYLTASFFPSRWVMKLSIFCATALYYTRPKKIYLNQLDMVS